MSQHKDAQQPKSMVYKLIEMVFVLAKFHEINLYTLTKKFAGFSLLLTFVEDATKNAHDKANLTAPQPSEYPGHNLTREVMEYIDDEIDY